MTKEKEMEGFELLQREGFILEPNFEIEGEKECVLCSSNFDLIVLKNPKGSKFWFCNDCLLKQMLIVAFLKEF